MLEQLFNGDFASAIRQTVMGGGLGSEFTDPVRVPMVFTSTKRLRMINPEFATNGLLNAISTSTDATLERAARAAASAGSPLYSPALPMIEMAVNPNSIDWKQAKRQVKRDTQEGSVIFHFANSRGQDNDLLILTFRGNTGYINFRGDTQVGGALSTVGDSHPQTYKKLLIWHNLWNLSREEILLEDGITNEFMIVYNSPVIPTQIMLFGYFSSVLEWTDSAEKPFSKDYNFTFTVTDTMPQIDQIIEDLSVFVQDVGATTE